MEDYDEKTGDKPLREKTDRREKIEKAVFSFLRYFFPAAKPMFLYLLVEFICILLGALIVNMGMPFEDFIKKKINIYSTLGVIITLYVLWKRSKKRGSTFFEDATLYRDNISIKKTICCFFFGIGVALALSSVISLLPSVGPVAAYEESVSSIYERWSVLLGMLFTTFVTPLVEEVIFRGYMLNRLLPHWGERLSLFAVSFVFAVMHGTAIWMIYAFLMGWVIGKVSIIEDNIFYAIVMHIGFNLPAAVIWFIYLTVYGAKEYLDKSPFAVFLIGVTGAAAAGICFNYYKKVRSGSFN